MPRISIRLQLLALVAAVAVPLVALLAYTIYSNSRQAVAEVKANAHVLAVVAASDVSRILAANRDVLNQIAKRPVIREVDSKHCDQVLWDFMGMFPKSANMTVVGLDGTALCSAVPQPGGKPVNVAKSEWFKRSQETDDFVVSKPFFGPITGRWVTVLTYPIHDNAGKKIGYLGLPLDLALYVPNLSGAPLFPGSTVGIVTADMKMVWRNIDTEKWVGKDISDLGVARQLVGMKSGEMEGAGLDGVPRFYAITPIEGADWFVYVGIPSDSVYSRARVSLLRNILLGVASLMGFMGVALFVARRIEKPVQELVETARAVKNGNNEIRARLEGAPEIVEVAEEFNEMLDVRFLAEAAMMKSEIELSEALKIAKLGYWEYDVASGNFIFNDQYYSLHHTTAAAMGGYQMSAADFASKLVHPEDAPSIGLHIQKALDAQDAGFYAETETRILCVDGEIRWVQVRFKVEKDKQGKTTRLIGANQDISERKKAEEELCLMNERYALATRAGRLGVWDWNLQENVLLWDERMYELYGVKRDDFAGAYEAWLSGIHPDDRAYSDEISKQAQRGEREYDTEFRVVWPDGSIHYLKAQGQFVRDKHGRPLRMTGVNFDITGIKEAEKKINELNRDLEQRVAERTEQLQAANKELEAFSYSVSHDLRTPLRAIDGFSHILLDDYTYKLDDEGKRLLKMVQESTGRMGQLIDDILKFSRTGRTEITHSEIDMERMARAVAAELMASDPGGKLQMEIEPIPATRGDSAMLRQVFVNLLSNAIKFSRHNAMPKIHVGASVKDNETIYYVKDNGAGFDMQFADRLFGVFQRLHGVTEFEGTGIGLAIVKRIITRHGGRVWAEGKVNEGATIFFSLPTQFSPEQAAS